MFVELLYGRVRVGVLRKVRTVVFRKVRTCFIQDGQERLCSGGLSAVMIRKVKSCCVLEAVVFRKVKSFCDQES
jgi:hypothetical protein